MTLFESLKALVLVIILLFLAPFIVKNLKRHYSALLEPRTAVAVIPICGAMGDSFSSITYLRQYSKDPEIKAVLLKIDSAGGALGAAESIFREITALKQEYAKPVIALVENVCTGGGYLIACAADYIIAPGASMIGVSFAEDKKISPDVADDVRQQVYAMIAKARKLSLHEKAKWADKIMSGEQALQLKLIDGLGSMYTAIKILKERALIEGDVECIYPRSLSSTVSSLIGGGDDCAAGTGSLPTLWTQVGLCVSSILS